MPFARATKSNVLTEHYLLRACEWLLLAMIISIVVMETFDLTVYPVIDTGMWFGDESWTMATLSSMIRGGVARVPEALGSSLSITNGFVNGSVWIAAVLYGIPALVFHSLASPVVIGRAITLVVVLVTLYVIYRFSVRIGASTLRALFVIFLFVISPGLHVLSHSARLDALTGLAVLLCLAYYLFLTEQRDRTIRHYLLLGITVPLSLAVYVHVPTLIALPALWTLVKLRPDWKQLFATAAGGIGSIALLLGIYWLTTGEVFLFGHNGGYNQYDNVLRSLPILHPLSLAVQRINTIDRFNQVYGLIPQLVTLIALGIAVAVLFRKQVKFSRSQRTFVELAILMTLSWMAFEGPAVFYNLHAFGVFTVFAALLISIIWSVFPPKLASGPLAPAIIVIAIYLSVTSVPTERKLASNARRIARGNERAIAALLAPVTLADTGRALVLTDEPGYDAIMANPRFRLMTKHLLLFGGEDMPLPEILKEHRVQYLMLYSTWRWQSPFRPIADSLYQLVGEQRGALTDQARDYDKPLFDREDTLRLYQAKR